MINSTGFSERLQKIIDFYDETASGFAENIGVQRSSISHILSGRNKPSLDFVMKVLQTYPEVELFWLLNGKGQFPSKQNNKTPTLTASPEVPNPDTTSKIQDTEVSIDRIVIFYSDGTFKSYNP